MTTVSGMISRIMSGLSVTGMALALGWWGGSGAFLIVGGLGLILAVWALTAGLRSVEAV